MKRGLLLLWVLAFTSWAHAESAYEQALRAAGPGYRPPELPTPQMQCETCGRSIPPPQRTPKPAKATSRSSGYGYSPGMAVGAAIFGSFLQGVFAPEDDGGPDPEELRRQEEARRAAEAEARRRAAEEAARHARLVASLSSLPTKTMAGSQPTAGLGLSALAAMDAPSPGATDESLRAAAGAAWDDPGWRFAIRWRPMPWGGKPVVLDFQEVCRGRTCTWPDGAAVPTVVSPGSGKTRHLRLSSETMAQLLRAAKNRPSPIERPWEAIMAELARRESEAAAQARYLLLRKTVQTGKELLWAMMSLTFDKVGGDFGKMINYGHDVFELTQTDLQDALAAAAWLGSPDTATPPQITPLEEAAQPFLLRGITENYLPTQWGLLSEKEMEKVGLFLDSTQLAQKLMSIWQEQVR